MAKQSRPNDPLEYWHRRLCPVADWLVLSGDLHHLRHHAEAQVAQWRSAGITAVIDTRVEWSDADLVAEVAPEIRYAHPGTHDDGGHQDDAWFDAGLTAYRDAVSDSRARLLVHCHMGINRGPSMAYRLLLEAGEDPITALEAIRRARPIAAIAYASDALDHFHRASDAPPRIRTRDFARLEVWMAANRIDLASLIRRTRAEVG